MEIPIDTPIGFIGLLMLVVGLFLLLTGFSIVKIQKVTVTPGRNTWGIGLIFFLLGIALVVIGDPTVKPPSTGSAAELATPTLGLQSGTVATTAVTILPTGANQPDPYALLAEASNWPVTESESFDDSDPAWNGFGTYSNEYIQHNMRIEGGRLIWGITLLGPNQWYWQASPYYSYSDFYLSFKFKRNQDGGNFTRYGLMFRKEGDRFYMFRVDDNQRFSVYLFEFDNWVPLIDWVKEASIRPDRFNELTVIAEGEVMNFFINRIHVGTVTDSTLTRGEVAFLVGLDEPGPEVTFEFDDFELREKP